MRDAGSTGYHRLTASATAITLANPLHENSTAPEQQARYGSTAADTAKAGTPTPLTCSRTEGKAGTR